MSTMPFDSDSDNKGLWSEEELRRVADIYLGPLVAIGNEIDAKIQEDSNNRDYNIALQATGKEVGFRAEFDMEVRFRLLGIRETIRELVGRVSWHPITLGLVQDVRGLVDEAIDIVSDAYMK